jgi:ketosteroid isomerase-like protein
MPLREDGAFLLEYHGVCKEVGNYDQDYITLMRFKGDKITLFREYWDTTEVTRAMSGETAKFSTVSGLPDGEHLA